MNTPEIVQRPAVYCLEKKVKLFFWQLPFKIGKIFKELDNHLQNKGLTISGYPFIRYTDITWGESCSGKGFKQLVQFFFHRMSMRVALPLETPCENCDDLICTQVPSGKYLSLMHLGPYKNLGQTHQLFAEYVAKNNLNLKNEVMEVYLNDPHTTSPQDLKTLIVAPFNE